LIFELVLAALGGGAIFKLVELLFKYAGYAQSAEADFQSQLMGRVKELQARVTEIERELRIEQKARVEAEIRNAILFRNLKAMLEELNRLREDAELQPITFDEISAGLNTSAVNIFADVTFSPERNEGPTDEG